jgi:methylmalonyl-CoA mutase cobalamin-binding domain/chain
MNLIEELSKSIIEGNSDQAVFLAKEVVNQGIDINEAIFKGLNEGMRIVGELYEKKEYFLPEIIISADALYDALQIFQPYLTKQEIKHKAIIVIGVVRGDIHDIGKNVTKILLEASGYKVIDCGRNVMPETFIETIKKNNADVLALSTLMNPTLESIEFLIELLKEEGLRDNLRIIIGGAATSDSFADSIGVIHCDNAIKAVEILDKYFVGGIN